MDSLKSIRQDIRNLIDSRVQAGVLSNAAWLTTEVMQDHRGISGPDAALYTVLAYKALAEIVKDCIGKYQPQATTDSQLALPGFDHVQRAYPVLRDGERVLVPTDLMTDAEIDGRCEELKVMARGCLDHMKELRSYKVMRSQQSTTSTPVRGAA